MIDLTRAVAALLPSLALIVTHPAAAFTMRPHPDVKASRLLFTEALLGWCADQVAGHAFVPTKLDPSGVDWEASDENAKPVRRAKGKPAPAAAIARTHSATGVMVELSADKSRCFVQMEADRSDVLAAALKGLMVRPPLSGVQVQALKAPEGEAAVYALHAGKDGPLIAISINEYMGSTSVLTAELRRNPDVGAAP